MGVITELQKVSAETMRFMRGKYALDEAGDGKDELKFRKSGKTVLTVYIRDDHYDFLVIFGKAERTQFDSRRGEFPRKIQDIYDSSKTYHDGKWMTIPVADLETLNAVKQMVMIKKKPNRKPFPKEQAVYGDCGHRCDLCIHYTGKTTMDKDFMAVVRDRVKQVYGEYEGLGMRCPGCRNKPKDDRCEQKKCASQKGAGRCMECAEYPCDRATAGIRPEIDAKRSIIAEDVTWAILPYVDGQYGN